MYSLLEMVKQMQILKFDEKLIQLWHFQVLLVQEASRLSNEVKVHPITNPLQLGSTLVEQEVLEEQSQEEALPLTNPNRQEQADPTLHKPIKDPTTQTLTLNTRFG